MTGSRHIDRLPGSHFAVLSLAVLLLPAAASIASGQPAVSQQNQTAAPTPAGPEVAPRGQREVKEVTYGDWRKLCFKPAGAKLLCRTSITGTFATGQMAVRFDFIEREGDPAARLQLFTPVGMYLPAAVKLTVDQGTPYQVPYNWCLTNACIAATVADPKLVEEMASGQTLRLEFVDSNLLAVTTSVPLAQFMSVHQGAAAQTFEQDIDE